MEVIDALRSCLEIRDFRSERVPDEVKREILEAGRLAPSGMNLQHWRFVLVDSKEDVKKLADLSTTGKWVANADFAIVVATDPKYPFHALDAGRVTTYMQLAAWSRGVGSRIYTGLDEKATKEFLGIPNELTISVVIGFGYPAKKVIGKKNRKLLSEVAYKGKFGVPFG